MDQNSPPSAIMDPVQADFKPRALSRSPYFAYLSFQIIVTAALITYVENHDSGLNRLEEQVMNNNNSFDKKPVIFAEYFIGATMILEIVCRLVKYFHVGRGNARNSARSPPCSSTFPFS